MDKEFYCSSKRIATYLKKRGHSFIRADKIKGKIVYVFENDKSIDDSISEYKTIVSKCMF